MVRYEKWPTMSQNEKFPKMLFYQQKKELLCTIYS